MGEPYLLVTGFGPFEDVLENPSGALARSLDGRPDVLGRELPTAYRGAADEIDQLLGLGGGTPHGILSLGVHRGPGFRVEAHSGSRPPSERPDYWGEPWGVGPRPRLSTSLDVEACRNACALVSKIETSISEDAGGYVCDFVFGHILRRGSELRIPSLFLHVPPLDQVSVPDQEPVVHALLDEMWRQILALP